ncbi:MAG: ead/Ea22-like family protein [Atlantibacter hermannii]|uniref:ead/Ea22-like family protein n=1 Tax=Atlantibacter hermannii TaxID=565 RepID=UPI0029005760|nr:ead/Ea22-like family protein [Atlantibacter hermannii]MDU1953612.1 ead/Ea22-like family protein [Atlantibacter hermannii]
MTMTAEQRAQLRVLAERATMGDWRRASTRFNGITATPFTLCGEEVMLASASEKRDAEFIAAFNPALALTLLDELERKDKRIAELKEDSAELTRFKEVMKKSAEALTAGKPLNLESLFKGELASAMFAMMFAGEFKRSGAKNYLELLYEVPEFGELTVTIQKVEGKTPGQRIAELEARMVSVKPAEQYEDDSALLFTIDLNDDSEDYQTAQWLKELRRRRAAGINLTVEG